MNKFQIVLFAIFFVFTSFKKDKPAYYLFQ
jgi:hypothetical protein